VGRYTCSKIKTTQPGFKCSVNKREGGVNFLMKSVWTKSKLDAIDDKDLLIAILNERRCRLDPFSVLSMRLKKIIRGLDKQ